MLPISLYIHIPFCLSKCPYCDFYSVRYNEEKIDEYTDKLISSIRLYSETYNRPLKTVYFGGGTPSIIGTERLNRILIEVFNYFEVEDNAEITLEMNPRTDDLIDFNKLKAAGFNRLSVGLQSANDNELIILQRNHNRFDVMKTVNRAREAGFDNISLDLMIALPEQDMYSLFKSIEFCKACKVEHISSYILKYEENTPFYRKKETLQRFDDDKQADFYEFTVNMCDALGYRQYEISNFAVPGYESKHNLTYWHDEEYLGLGPSAHSYIDGKRFYFNRSFSDFYNNITVYESEGGSEEEYIMLALRLNEGLVFEKYRNRFKKDISEQFIFNANKLKDSGYINIDENRISLTLKGFLVSNNIISYLLDYL